ncbi:MAG: hypothetical protein J6C52_13575 [Clostridia bacterium]|nr:hypothetical protein [Clostridia bacterium]
MNRLKNSPLIAIAIGLALVLIGMIGIKTDVDLKVDALRFTESHPEQAVSEEIRMTGTISRHLNGRKQFEGILTIGKQQIECSLNLRSKTPIFADYQGSQRRILGMFLLIDGNFDSAAIKLGIASPEYIIWGMTVEEFLAQEMR